MFTFVGKNLKILFKLSHYQKPLFLFLTAVIGVWILWPLNNFQFFLAQGDHGRELYGFKKTMEGALPYRDYSWLYGPLMPYYYSAFYHMFGVSIQSVLLGQNLLIWSSGILIYLSCAIFISPAMSFAAAIWYWAFRGAEFFYAYNHSGGVLAFLSTIYFLFRYIRQPKTFDVSTGFMAVSFLMLIRFNMGMAVLVAFFLSLCLTDFLRKDVLASKKKYSYIRSSLLVLAGVSLIYWLLLHPLPSYVIQQSFPFSKSHRLDNTVALQDTLFLLWEIVISYATASWPRLMLSFLFLLCAAQLALLVIRRQLPEKEKISVILVCASLSLFILLALHEFLASGVHYRIIWLRPLLILMVFYFFDMATKNIGRGIFRISLLIVFFYLSLLQIMDQNFLTQFFKKSENGLQIGKNKIYTSQNREWFDAVTEATQFIIKHVPENEKIFALPNDSLYYFLSGRDAGTRQLVFFDHVNIPPEQEQKTIRDLEINKVNYIVLSNRSDAQAEGLGTFGKTYCPILSKYIDENFKVEATFGDWKNEPGWAWNHGTKILRRVAR